MSRTPSWRRCDAWRLGRRAIALGSVLLLLLSMPALCTWLAQELPVFRAAVDLVVLPVAVTGPHGEYVHGLRAADFRVRENDGAPQKISFFEEVSVASPSPHLGSSFFVLLDTSNIMYPDVVYAQDAITDFVRTLDPRDPVAVYGFSRNLLRACPLTSDRQTALARVRQMVAGDDTAIYNAILLTLEDMISVSGRKTLVVFSNGPDNASVVSPQAVGELAESHGVSIYIITTQTRGRDRFTTEAFENLAARTGGKAYFANTWRREIEALDAVRGDLQNLYVIGYYPVRISNAGWRKITVELTGSYPGKYQVRTRSGYRPGAGGGNTQAPNLPVQAGGTRGSD